MNWTAERITAALQTNSKHREIDQVPEQSLIPAAVLLPLFQDQNIWNLLFIKRAHHRGDRHSGQIAFPGGRMEPGDGDLIDTALRESREEIGLKADQVQILGALPPLDTVTDYRVTPFVGLISWPFEIRLSPLEVDQVITIPLDWLMNPEHYQIQDWTPNPEQREPEKVIFYRRYQGELLWGATARMVLDLIQLLDTA